MADTGPKGKTVPIRNAHPQSNGDVMSRARVTRSINAPANEVWKTLCDFNRVEKFLPAVASCTVYGSGVGARRVCTLQDGSRIFERLVTLNQKDRVLRYSVTQTLMPFQSYLGMIEVRDLGGRRCEIEWSSSFEAVGTPRELVTGMIESMYSQSIEGLEKLHGVDSCSSLKP